MDNELKSILQDVILEALEPINQRLDRMDQRFDRVDQSIIDTGVQMNSRFDALESELYLVKKDITVVKEDVSDIKASVNLLAKETPQDVMGMLKQINAKLDEKDSDVQALNKRLFRVESTLERMTAGEQ